MIGQGSPDPPCRRIFSILRGLSRRSLLCGLLFLLRVADVYGDHGELPLGLRIEWGGAGPWQWTGRLWLDEGELLNPRTIISSADAPGSIFVDGKSVLISQPRSRPFDGCDVFAVGAPESALLNIELRRQGRAIPYVHQIPLRDLFNGFREIDLDDQENRLLVQRIPGDKLAVRLDRTQLVFAPGEQLNATITPNIPAKLYDALRLITALYDIRGKRVSELSTQDFKANHLRGQFAGLSPVSMRLPAAEGVYELDIRLNERPRRRLARPKSVAHRKIQLVVIGTLPGPRTDVAMSREVARIEPSARRRRNIFTKIANIPGLESNQPLDNGHSQIWQHANQSFMQLEPGGWHAYPMTISQPGVPHFVEVSYPADIAQTFTVSVVEGSESGRTTAIPFHSGVHVSTDTVTESGGIRQHRMLFWPHTDNLRVVLTNQHTEIPAAFGTIRVEEWTSGLPPAADEQAEPNPRQLLAYFEKPWFTKNFYATSVASDVPPSELHDWQTFYEGGTRLVEYLRHVGYDGTLLNVYGRGSTLYPSPLLGPNTKYDTGAFLQFGQDPFRKDVLEMLLRLFDREGLTLVPTLRFDAPLPRLERHAQSEIGLRLLGEDGRPWVAANAAEDGAAPHYNPLHPRVQDAMLEVVQEFVARYAHHASFGGLALDISPRGFAVLPGTYWGLDDHTVARFNRDSRITLPGQGEHRFGERAQQLRQNQEVREQWLYWRASQVAAFHHRVHAAVSSRQPSAKLFLISSELFDSPTVREVLAPTLPPKGDAEFAQALLGLGIDPQAYGKDGRVVLVQPRQVDLPGVPGSEHDLLQIDKLSEADFYFGGIPTSACLSYHTPYALQADGWADAMREEGPSRAGKLLLSPSGIANRRRLAEALSRRDAQMLIEGGAMLPVGQEESVRDFLSVVRQLPATPFTDVKTKVSTQPAVIRKLRNGDRTCVYLVNESAWEVQIELELKTPSKLAPLQPLGSTMLPNPVRQGNDTWWTVSLEPYGLAAAWFDTPQLEILSARTILPAHVEPQLEQRIQLLKDRFAQLERKPQLDLPVNPSFEQDPFAPAASGNWESLDPTGQRIEWQSVGAYSGMHCLGIRMRHGDPLVTVQSAPFVAPATGRFQTQVYLRVADVAKQPELRFSLEFQLQGRPTARRTAIVGANSDKPLTEKWEKYILPVDDLPLDGITEMRICLDVVGEGDVRVDHVQTSALEPFSTHELRELMPIIGSAGYHLRERNFSKCQQVLDGYWPRFLEKHVLLPNRRMAAQPPILVPRQEPRTPPAGGETEDNWFNNVKQRLPRWLRF